MEVCCTLGMLNESQAKRLKDAGLTAYNHNLDTSPEFYGNIITTHLYEDRLQTIAHVRKAGITVCCGGVVGLRGSDRGHRRPAPRLLVLSSLSARFPDTIPS